MVYRRKWNDDSGVSVAGISALRMFDRRSNFIRTHGTFSPVGSSSLHHPVCLGKFTRVEGMWYTVVKIPLNPVQGEIPIVALRWRNSNPSSERRKKCKIGGFG